MNENSMWQQNLTNVKRLKQIKFLRKDLIFKEEDSLLIQFQRKVASVLGLVDLSSNLPIIVLRFKTYLMSKHKFP